LDYACRAKNIRNKPEINQKLTKKALLKEYINEIDRLKANLSAARDKNGFYVLKETYDEMELTIKESKDRIEELDNQIKAVEIAKRDLEQLFSLQRAELDSVTKSLDSITKIYQETSQKLNETVHNLEETKQVVQQQKEAIKEHENVEIALITDANKLYTTLTDTLTDVDGLYKKIERKSSVEDENKRKTSAFTRYFTNIVNETEKKVVDFNECHKRSLVQISESIHTFMLEKNEVCIIHY
jgi:kinesin family protein 11